MLWEIRALMKPALSVIDLIPNVHRTPALTLLRRTVLDGRPAVLRLSGDEKELAFQDTSVPLTSPIGARVLLALYHAGHLKLKKPALRSLPALEAYAATETAFRAAVDRILAEEDSRRQRLAEIIADPACARPDELSPYLIDKVMSAHLGHSTYGTMQIASLACHRSLSAPATADHDRLRPEGQVICWWLDAAGLRQGDPA